MGAFFDKVDDIITCGSATSLDALGPLTYSAWINAISIGENNNGVILSKANGTANFTSFAMGPTATLRFDVDYNTTDLARIASNNSCSLNVWHHVLATWDGSTTASNSRIYVDGIETSYQTTTNGDSTRQSDAAFNQHIGNTSSVNLTFDGIITEAAIWNVVLTTLEIENLAKSRIKGIPLQIRPDALKAYWPLNEYSENSAVTVSARDLSGNGNVGTPSSFATNAGRAEMVLSYL